MRKLFYRVFISLFIVSVASASILLNENSTQNKALMSKMIHSNIKELSSFLEQSSSQLIKKLEKKNIFVNNPEQTVVHIALANTKEAVEIIDILIEGTSLKQ